MTPFRRALLPVLSLLLAGWAAAAEPASGSATAAATAPAGSPAVATVNGSTLTLREIEDAMLKKEGSELVEEWVHRQLEGLDFTALRDEDVILAIGFNKITRREIADSLLRKGAGKVRDDLINVRLVEQAIAEAKITIGPAELDAAWARMAKRFEDDVAKRGDTRIDFANYLQVKEKMTPAQFRAQPGFRMIAGLQALVHAKAANEWDDTDLRAWFAANTARWRQSEAVELAVIAIPYRQEPGPDGTPVVTPDERERLMQVMDSLHRQISAKPASFAQVYALYARSYDPQAAAGGRLGWVPRDGKREGADDKTRIVSGEVMAAAWAVERFPALLPPLASPWGVEIAQVLAHRPAREPVYEELRERIKADRIDDTLDQRTQALLASLRRAAKIEYASLPEVINGAR